MEFRVPLTCDEALCVSDTLMTCGNRAIEITDNEWSVMRVLWESSGVVVHHERFHTLLGLENPRFDIKKAAVSLVVRSLRVKLDTLTDRRVHIRNVYGLGYRLMSPTPQP